MELKHVAIVILKDSRIGVDQLYRSRIGWIPPTRWRVTVPVIQAARLPQTISESGKLDPAVGVETNGIANADPGGWRRCRENFGLSYGLGSRRGCMDWPRTRVAGRTGGS
jgi:hypothetical protein